MQMRNNLISLPTSALNSRVPPGVPGIAEFPSDFLSQSERAFLSRLENLQRLPHAQGERVGSEVARSSHLMHLVTRPPALAAARCRWTAQGKHAGDQPAGL